MRRSSIMERTEPEAREAPAGRAPSEPEAWGREPGVTAVQGARATEEWEPGVEERSEDPVAGADREVSALQEAEVAGAEVEAERAATELPAVPVEGPPGMQTRQESPGKKSRQFPPPSLPNNVGTGESSSYVSNRRWSHDRLLGSKLAQPFAP
jgi:hypothetical protein